MQEKVLVKTFEENHCPFCGSSELRFGPAYGISNGTNDTYDSNRIICQNCGRNFEQTYKLVFYDQYIGEDFNISVKDSLGTTVEIEDFSTR